MPPFRYFEPEFVNYDRRRRRLDVFRLSPINRIGYAPSSFDELTVSESDIRADNSIKNRSGGFEFSNRKGNTAGKMQMYADESRIL